MTTKLNIHDAVKCNTKEEWAEVLRLAAMHDVPINNVATFDYSYFYYHNDFSIHSTSVCFNVFSLPLNSFDEFCEKIKNHSIQEVNQNG